jgi:hypothetical protein
MGSKKQASSLAFADAQADEALASSIIELPKEAKMEMKF